MLLRALALIPIRLPLLPLLLAAWVLPEPAAATRIEYSIVSSQDIGTPPFSGIFSEDGKDPGAHDDDRDGHKSKDKDKDKSKDKKQKEDEHGGYGDDWHDGHGHEPRIFSDDLSGVLALSSDDPDLFVDGGTLRVEEFSLVGSVDLCNRCGPSLSPIAIALDPRFSSVLELEDGELAGTLHLLLTIDGSKKELTVYARGETADGDSSFLTPDFVSLLLELDFGKHGQDPFDCDDDWKKDPKQDRVFLQAQGPVVPEPGSFGLVAGGLLALRFGVRRRRQRGLSPRPYGM